VTDDLLDADALSGFGDAARRAVLHAGIEARELGHDRIGTEHLLLGILAADESVAAGALTDAGVGLAAARRKVSEAVGPTDARRLRTAALSGSPRALRAAGRAARFAHARRAASVGSEHLLLGVLDVEGTAGQVLRGLGVDVDRLRTTLATEIETADTATDPSQSTADAPVATLDTVETVETVDLTTVPPMCPSCAREVDGSLRVRTVMASGPGATTRDALVFSCGDCGHVLGVAPA
jgi:ATP-dependent Clp protease ATP-binding subunit ClpA